MVSFLRQWNGVGFGLIGEQGAESVHAEFNSPHSMLSQHPRQAKMCSARTSYEVLPRCIGSYTKTCELTTSGTEKIVPLYLSREKWCTVSVG